MMLPPPPRAWVDWAVPTDPRGREVGSANSLASCHFYLSWLADYLVETEIEVPECQREMLENYRRTGGARWAAHDLGSTMGFLVYDIENLERLSAQGVPWETVHAMELRLYERFSAGDRENLSREEFCVSREDYERIGREAKESKKVPSHIQHADIPFRSVFAALLKEVPDHEARYRYLDGFYSSFRESASK